MNRQEIENLILLKQEGDYWDFKREWYTPQKKADLLHDIICMSNNLSNRDAYIIIGIDEETNYSFSSVKKDPNRKNTQQLVDFIRDKHFAGNIRPVVHVETLEFNDVEIDIIIIHNSNNTPFYLTEKFSSVNPYNIYTRIMDTNTPINKSADLPHVEMLWKKRFGLLVSPLERMKIYLKQSDLWDSSPYNINEKMYYRFSPEFTIEKIIDETHCNAYQYYLFNQTDTHPNWYDINLYYHQTMLTSFEGVSLDGGRYFTPSPKTDGITLTQYNHWDITFKYFIKSSIEYIVHQFYYQQNNYEEKNAHDRFVECIIIFEDNDEKETFKKYIINNWKNKQKYNSNILLPCFPEIKGYNMSTFKEEFKNSQILKKMFIEFKNNKKIKEMKN